MAIAGAHCEVKRPAWSSDRRDGDSAIHECDTQSHLRPFIRARQTAQHRAVWLVFTEACGTVPGRCRVARSWGVATFDTSLFEPCRAVATEAWRLVAAPGSKL